MSNINNLTDKEIKSQRSKLSYSIAWTEKLIKEFSNSKSFNKDYHKKKLQDMKETAKKLRSISLKRKIEALRNV